MLAFMAETIPVGHLLNIFGKIGKQHIQDKTWPCDVAVVSKLLCCVIFSAKELFQWRKKENLSVPQRGGTKDFEPDGSWLQAKRLEAFREEHLSVLAEPRVEKRWCFENKINVWFGIVLYLVMITIIMEVEEFFVAEQLKRI